MIIILITAAFFTFLLLAGKIHLFEMKRSWSCFCFREFVFEAEQISQLCETNVEPAAALHPKCFLTTALKAVQMSHLKNRMDLDLKIRALL